ncbi:MAG: hypothetical protein COU90_01855 [Candidatus Ryanbacteria bacterium CG10_big_fil_rev_8_21_14_0_10_43_42]|uniref:Peptidoglycan binding-like domain-containing protein n=1 Tax=Candidatus Ryanbacteria bacterium CG10_big_fil_rev_8_21_14_0_10_43_42 TaxID=1974864 RepID=A0A2M8KXA5_9BACT|nr:MAG: hypothetical protein COU90_01855 [Candidatus Ryanbacteria bacterium CG10_big_fil_rev_8_21_14_0_10_43_42]
MIIQVRNTFVGTQITWWLGAVFLVATLFGARWADAITTSQDVTLQAATGGDVTMISGSSFDTLTTSGNFFTFTLSGAQSVTLRDSDKHIMKTNVSDLTFTCNEGNSELVISASDAASIQVSIEGFSCGGGPGGGGSGGGSSSGSSSSSTTDTTSTATTETADDSTTTVADTTTTDDSRLSGTGTAAALEAAGSDSSPITTSNNISTAGRFPDILKLSRGLDIGSEGNDVRSLQEALASMPDLYPEGIVSGYYGSLTRAAIAAFQMKYGVVSSANDAGYGYVGPMTRAKLIEVFGGSGSVTSGSITSTGPVLNSSFTFTRELQLGDENNDVLQLQTFLAGDASLYPEGIVSGYYGSLTQAAVRRFQAKYGISQVGRVGPQTMAKLNEVMGSSGNAPSTTNGSTDDTAEAAALKSQIEQLQDMIGSLNAQLGTDQ